MKYLVISLLVALSLCISTVALADSFTFDCLYTDFSNEAGRTKIHWKMSFTMDTATTESYVTSNLGRNEVLPMTGEDGLTFIDQSDKGSIYTTSMILNGSSVHSRHSIIDGELIASQYYGTCHVVEFKKEKE